MSSRTGYFSRHVWQTRLGSSDRYSNSPLHFGQTRMDSNCGESVTKLAPEASGIQTAREPARHDASSDHDTSLPPMGARFRLKASFDISRYSAQTQVVLRAMQTYGLVLADNGSPWYFQGTADNSWPDGLISQLKTIPASALEAVDTSRLEISPSSGAAR